MSLAGAPRGFHVKTPGRAGPAYAVGFHVKTPRETSSGSRISSLW